MRSFLLAMLLSTTFSSLAAQSMTDTTRWFDFWIGEWELTWDEGQGNKGKGINIIESTLDGKVIQENFKALEGNSKGFKGTSISVWSPQGKQWKQAWADNQGGYFDFTGAIIDGEKVFHTEMTERDGKQIQSRMVFRDVQKDQFVWDWESTTDGGETWTINWKIHYQRKK